MVIYLSTLKDNPSGRSRDTSKRHNTALLLKKNARNQTDGEFIFLREFAHSSDKSDHLQERPYNEEAMSGRTTPQVGHT